MKKIAVERIERLYDLAKERELAGGDDNDKLAMLYIALARRIGMHYRVRMPKEVKNNICKKCNRVLIPGITCTVRVVGRDRCLVYRCKCGAEKRVFYD